MEAEKEKGKIGKENKGGEESGIREETYGF